MAPVAAFTRSVGMVALRGAAALLKSGMMSANNKGIRMRVFVLAVLLTLPAAAAFADPIPRVNIALVRDGREVAATTTLEDGGATLQALRDGEYELALQSPLPRDARLTALVRREVWSVDLLAGPPTRDGALSFPARTGDVIELCLQTLDAPAPPPDAADFPIALCARETTGGAGHADLPGDLPVSDIDPTLPAPAAPDPAVR